MSKKSTVRVEFESLTRAQLEDIKRSRMKGVERILHHALRPFRVSGEWYRLSPSQLAGMAEPLARLVGTKLGDDDPIRVFRQPLPETRFEDFAPVALRDRSEYFWLLSSPPTHQD